MPATGGATFEVINPSNEKVMSSDFMKCGASATTDFQSLEPDLYGTRLHASFIQHVLETDPGPERVTRGAIRPLPAWYARLEEASRVAGALVRCGRLNTRQSVKYIVQRQRQCLIHMAAHRQAKLADINIGRDDRPVPAHIELIIGGEDTLIEDFKRRFQKRRTRPRQDHRSPRVRQPAYPQPCDTSAAYTNVCLSPNQ
jgi:hypothetical protein